MAQYTGTSGDDTYQGGTDDDVIEGLGGHDSLSGGGGADRIYGGEGDDVLTGGSGVDILAGGPGDDIYVDQFIGEGGATVVELAGEGIDEIRNAVFSYSLAAHPNVENLTGDQSTYSAVTLTGNSLANRITGGRGNDVLDGAGGDDILIGGEGGDTASFVAPVGLTGTLDLIPVGASGDFDVELSTGSETQILFEVRLGGGSRTVTGVGNAAAMGTALLIQIEGVQFRTAGDRAPQISHGLGQPVFDGIAGSSAADAFAGTAGADRYHGYAGDDDISGQAGSDYLVGGSGKDRLRGGADRDFLFGGGGDDSLEGEDGHDHIEGGEGDDLLAGGAGNDMIQAGAGSDILRGGLGDDMMVDSAGAYDRLLGEEGNDRITVIRAAGSPASTIEIEGGTGWDQLTLNVAGPGVVHADLSGSDYSYTTIERMESDLTLLLGAGGDSITFTGAASDPQMRGSITLIGFTPTDRIEWGTYLRPLLTGWDWNAMANPFASGHLRWRQSGPDGLLEIDFDGGADSFETLITFRDVTVTHFTEIGWYSPIRIDEGDGTYTYVAGREMDVLTAGDGDDDLNLAGWFVDVDAGAGDDRIFLSSPDAGKAIDGGAGTDELILGRNPYSPIGNLHGIEILRLHPGLEPWFGTASGGLRAYSLTMLDSAVAPGATLAVDASGLASGETFDIDASAETDGRYELLGNAASNLLRSGAGDDLLDGGAGGDRMIGGTGSDVYHVDDAGDTIEENPGEGTDEVRTSLAGYSLVGTNLENLTGTSGAAQDLRGNSGDNVITGGPGSDVLRLQDGGDDTVNGGAGSDNIFFIGLLTSADVVRGGSETDTLVLQGPYGTLALTANITEIENISLLGGGNTAFGEPGTNRHDYVLITHDMNFAAGLQVRINGAALLEGEDFTFDGSAETDARFVVFGGKGRDTLTGGLGHDIFFFAEDGRFATGDTVNGGAGYDGMFLRGNYTIDFNAPGYTGLFTNIENLTLTSATDERYARGGGTEFDYNLTLSNAIVKPGETLTVSGALLMTTETMILDAGQELDGLLRLFGGRASDTLKGGANADLLHGNLGGDSLTGNGGADVFRIDSAADSNSAGMDEILDFTPGTDRIDLGRIDANSLVAGDQAFTWIGTDAFSGTAGELRARQDGTSWFVEGDTDGDGAADLVIALTLYGPDPIGGADFLL